MLRMLYIYISSFTISFKIKYLWFSNETRRCYTVDFYYTSPTVFIYRYLIFSNNCGRINFRGKLISLYLPHMWCEIELQIDRYIIVYVF